MLDDKRNDIISDHYDLAFRIGKLDDSNLMAKISDMHFAPVASHDFIARHGMPNTPEELFSFTCNSLRQWRCAFQIVKLSTQPHGDEYKPTK
ncbi:hypothetical protein ACOBV8_18600 (plasmid) [Pseudoalteromonas espejiana]